MTERYTDNASTLGVFQDILNRSELVGNVSNKSMLIKIDQTFFLMIYIEINDSKQSQVKMLILNLDFGKIDEIIGNVESEKKLDSASYFIDEIKLKKDELIDKLLKQRLLKTQKPLLKEKTVQEEQLQLIERNRFFKKIINREILKNCKKLKKSNQSEIADICYKSMLFRFKNLKTVTSKDEIEIKDWLNIFLSHLGVVQ